jgi:hypothetical protein
MKRRITGRKLKANIEWYSKKACFGFEEINFPPTMTRMMYIKSMDSSTLR